MPRRSDRNKHLQILVSNDTYERLQAIADERGMNLSDLVRDALKHYLEEHLNITDVDFSVDRGGRRKSAQSRRP